MNSSYAMHYARQVGGNPFLCMYLNVYPIYQGAEITPQGLRDINIKELHLLAAQLTEREPLVKVECMLFDGKLIDVIKQLEEAMQISMVIMGITGVGKMTEKLVGSNTLDVSRYISTPVLIPESFFCTDNDIGLTTDFVVQETYGENGEDHRYNRAKLHVLNVDYAYRGQKILFESGLVK
jgi:hypothetical protein